MAFDERAFFTERPETRPARYTCPRCRRTHEYSVRWVRRVRKDRPPQGIDAHDRAKFDKLRDHLLRLDEDVVCRACSKRFEIPSQHSLLFIDQIEGLPKDVEEEEDAAASPPAPSAPARPLPPRFTRPSRGWKG